MKYFFDYNWQVRDEWFDYLRTFSEEELHKKRIGGVGSIAHTLYHIIDVEHSWLHDLQNKIEPIVEFENCQSLEALARLSQQLRPALRAFVEAYQPEMECIIMDFMHFEDNTIERFRMGEIMRHVIAHEIHHIGQLSVWVREFGAKPPTSNFIRRHIFS